MDFILVEEAVFDSPMLTLKVREILFTAYVLFSGDWIEIMGGFVSASGGVSPAHQKGFGFALTKLTNWKSTSAENRRTDMKAVVNTVFLFVFCHPSFGDLGTAGFPLMQLQLLLRLILRKPVPFVSLNRSNPEKLKV